jgi:L-asparaginase II
MFLEEFRKEAESWGPGKCAVVEERNGLIEAFHSAHIAAVDSKGKLLYSSGDPHHITYSRSCIKPIQALPVLYTGAADEFKFTDREIAIISGSHSGEDKHLDTVRSILEKAGLDEGLLKCKGHVPFNKEQAKSVGQNYTALHDNCSGKHAGALAVCKYKGWDHETYIQPDHPLTKEIVNYISKLTGLEKDDIYIGSDGCDIPNFAIPIYKMAHLFSLLLDPGDGALSPSLRRIGNAMIEHPFMVAGTERFDTVIMNDLSGILLSKAGAAGLQTVAVRSEDGNMGISIKIEDGAYSSVIPLLTYHVLSELGIKSESENKYNTPLVKTRSGKIVGSIHSFGNMVKY